MSAPFTPEQLVCDLVAAGEPQLSPDGASIVYSLGRADGEADKNTSQLWLCARDGSEPRQLTFAGSRNTSPRWSPDGRCIAFVSDRSQGSGLFVLPASGAGEAREVTRHRPRISGLAWSPDCRSIAYATLFDPENPQEHEPPETAAPKVRITRRLDYKQDNRGYLGDARSQVFVVDVETGERRRLTQEAFDYEHPQWSPDGQCLAARVSTDGPIHSQLALIQCASGEARRVGPEDGSVDVWSWSPRGDRIVYAGDPERTRQADFFLYDLRSEQTRRLTDDLDCAPYAGFPTLIPPAQPVWLDERRVLFHAVRAGASGLYVLDVATGGVEREQRSESLDIGLSVDRAAQYAVLGHSSFEATGEVVAYDRSAGGRRLVTRLNQQLFERSPIIRGELFQVRRGEVTIDAWLLKPPDFDPSLRYPMVLDVHGGPHGYYGFAFNPIQQLLASNGFLVVYANPRGSGSYGRRFVQQVTRDWGGEDYLDLMAVVDRVLEHAWVDSERLGIWGYSYGGYMTAWAIGHTDRFRAAVCGAPCFDLESMYGTSDISHTWGLEEWGGPPHEQREWYAAHSPSSVAHRARTPTLILQGEADQRCPVGQSEQMFVALKQAGVETELVRYPGGAHAMLRVGPPSHRVDFCTRLLGWFRHYLNP
jgi:dipeptidyl aminopeptidase/acylaminoacyl peptidase